MSEQFCPECEQRTALITDVVTGAELLAALLEGGDGGEMSFAPESDGECLVYMLSCAACGADSLQSTQRIKILENPEPIG
jgi:hypothetical protein